MQQFEGCGRREHRCLGYAAHTETHLLLGSTLGVGSQSGLIVCVSKEIERGAPRYGSEEQHVADRRPEQPIRKRAASELRRTRDTGLAAGVGAGGAGRTEEQRRGSRETRVT